MFEKLPIYTSRIPFFVLNKSLTYIKSDMFKKYVTLYMAGLPIAIYMISMTSYNQTSKLKLRNANYYYS